MEKQAGGGRRTCAILKQRAGETDAGFQQVGVERAAGMTHQQRVVPLCGADQGREQSMK